MLRYICFLISCLWCQGPLSAQIVNIENIRQLSDTSKWSGNTGLSLGLAKNVNRIFTLSSKTRVQYLKKKHLFLFINDIQRKEANDVDLVNRSLQHLRYNYDLKDRITWEVFVQAQTDQISAINFRGLVGAGPRLRLNHSDDYQFFVGILSMFEYEDVDEATGNVIHRDWRNSTYASFRLYPKEGLSFVHMVYFQPKYSRFSDYRLSSNSTLTVALLKNLSLGVGFSYWYDANPPPGIPKEQYNLTNTLTYLFD